MRFVCLLMICLVSLFSCADSGSTPDTDSKGIPGSFAAIPAPSAMPVADLPGHTASAAILQSSAIFRLKGDEYDDENLPAPHVIPDNEANSAMLAGGTSSLTFCFFAIDDGVEPGMTYTRFMLEGDWVGGEPAEGNGIYVGFADWDQDWWGWQPPAENVGTWQELSAGAYEFLGTGQDHIVVVNYSEVDFRFHGIRIETDNPASVTGDEWLYYSQHNNHPTAPSVGIYRVRPEPGATPEPILEPGILEFMTRPHVAVILGNMRVGYARMYGDNTEIWHCGMLGQSPTRLSWSTEEHRYPVGWRPGGDSFLFLQSNDSDEYDLYVRDTVDKVTGLVCPADSRIIDACWDNASDTRFSVLLSKVSDVSESCNDVGGVHTGAALPLETEPSIFLGGLSLPGAPKDLCSFAFAGEKWSVSWGCVFSAHIIGSEDDAIYVMYYSLPDHLSYAKPLIVRPGFNLRFPSVSPDGRWLTFTAVPEGEWIGELYITPFTYTDTGTEFKVADNATSRPAWHDPTP